MESPVCATLTVGLSYIQQGLGSLREKLYTDTLESRSSSHDVETKIPFDATTPGPKGMIGLNLVSKFVRGSIRPRVFLGSGFAAIRKAVDDAAIALSENVAPSYDTINNTLINSPGQNLSDQQVQAQTYDMGSQTNGVDNRTIVEKQPDLGLDPGGESGEVHVSFPEDDPDPQLESLALVIYRPSQHEHLGSEQRTHDQGRQDGLPEYHANEFQDMNEEIIRLRLQRDDLLAQCIALDHGLSNSFFEKMELTNQLSRAEKKIEKGTACYERLRAEWKRDHAKLQDMTRLFKANSENERIVEMLRRQKFLEEEIGWLEGQLEMKAQDNWRFVRQREAVIRETKYERVCEMLQMIDMLRRCSAHVQVQLEESKKAERRLAEQLRQERLKHRATRDALELKTKMASFSHNVQQTAYAGDSAPQNPYKLTSTYPEPFQSRLPKAGTPPGFSSELKSEPVFGANPFFEPRAASGNVSQQYRTRSKSKFSFGHNTVPESTSSSTGFTTGVASQPDFNFTFGNTSDHHSSPRGYGDIPGRDLPKDSTSPANIFVASTFSANGEQPTTAPGSANCKQHFHGYHHGTHGGDKQYPHKHHLPPIGSERASKLVAKVTDSMNPMGDSGPKTTTETNAPYTFAKPTDPFTNPKARKCSKKPLASDFFNGDPVEAEVETKPLIALAAEHIIEETVGGSDISQKPQIRSSTDHHTTANGSIQAESGGPLKQPNPNPKPKPKSKRALSRKIAKERKRAAIGEADWSGSS